MNNIAKAFVAAKRAFAPALKTSTNPHFRSKYADLSGCLEAVSDALLDNGIALYQETFEDSTGVTVETVFLHESGESLRGGKLHVPAAKQDPQGYGSALTYARRYSVMAACGIAAEDDDGNAASRPKSRNNLDQVQASAARPKEVKTYHIQLPNKDEPHATHTKPAEWVKGVIAIMEKIEQNGKLASRDKMTKLRELKEANATVLEAIETPLSVDFNTDYQLRLRRLGAKAGEENESGGLE